MNLHGTGRRNGTYRSILLNATISQSGEKFPRDCLFSPMGLAPPSLYLLLSRTQGFRRIICSLPLLCLGLYQFFCLLSEEGGILEPSKIFNQKCLPLDYKKSSVMNEPTIPNLFNLLRPLTSVFLIEISLLSLEAQFHWKWN